MHRRARTPRAIFRGTVSNGLTADVWVPVWCVHRRCIPRLVAELASADVPAYCSRLRAWWLPATRSGEWCLWVGYGAYDRAQLKLAEILPALLQSPHRGGAEA